MRTTSLALLLLVAPACGGGGDDNTADASVTPPDGKPSFDSRTPPDAGIDAMFNGVQGTMIDTYVAPDGTETQWPNDLSVGHTIVAYVPNGNSWDTYNAVGESDGTFRIAGVPQGKYLLQVDVDFVQSTARTLDLGMYVVGRPDAATAGTSTQLTLNIPTVAAWGANDDLEVGALGVGAWNTFANSSMSVAEGATSISGTMSWLSPLVNASKGDRLWVARLDAIDSAPLGGFYLKISDYGTAGNSFNMVSDTNNSASATLSPVTEDQSVSLDWHRSDFAALATAINPSAMMTRQDLYVSAIPGGTSRGVLRPELTLVWSAGTAATDVDLGTVTYGNPYAASGVVGHAGASFVYQPQLPNDPPVLTRDGIISVDKPIADFGSGPITPMVSPPRNLKVNGQDALTELSGIGATPTLSWDAPATGTADFYIVVVTEAYAHTLGGHDYTLYSTIAAFQVTGTQIKFPPGIVPGSSHAIFEVRAVSTPGGDVNAHPFKFTLPRGDANAFTAILGV